MGAPGIRTDHGGPTGSCSDDEISVDDPQLIDALERYLAAVEAGNPPDLEAFLSGYLHFRDRLADCLAGLEAVRVARAGLPTPGIDSPPTTDFPADPPCLDLTSPVRLGDFELLREIGRGGMGVVYEASQLSLGRKVALKVLPFAATLDPRQLQRFKTEALAAACLHHPHIVPVYSVGFDRGVHHYAMQFIQGKSLLELIGQARANRLNPKPLEQRSGAWTNRSRTENKSSLGTGSEWPGVESPSEPFRFGASTAEDFRWIARLGIQAAEGLEHAHAMGVLHRDIKPANLMVNSRGHLWVTDFGLARVQAAASISQSGDILGTLRYMSPEQALARRTILDHRTDVYSLGATLYEALTLGPLFDGSDTQELVRQVINESPRPPRKLNPNIPKDLETIVLKALAKEPDERYGSAQEMAEDLRRFLSDQPILARRPNLGERWHRWARRHKPLVGAVAAVMVLALGVLSATTLLLAHERIRTMSEANNAVVSQRRFFALADEMYQQFVEQYIALEPEKVELQRRFLSRALAIYESFATDHANNPALGREAALAFRKAGDIRFRLGQYTEAEKAYQAARERFEQPGTVHPPVSDESVNDLAHILNRLARLNSMGMKYSKAQSLLEQAVSVQEKWVEGSRWTGPRLDLVSYLMDLGQHYALAGNEPRAEAIYNRALAISQTLADASPLASVPSGVSDESNALRLSIRSRLLRTFGDFVQAVAAYREAHQLYSRLTSREPGNPDYRLRRSESTIQLAWFLATCPNPTVRNPSEAAQLALSCVRFEPNNPSFHIQAAQILAQCDLFLEAESLLKQVIAQFPDRADAHNNLAWLLVTQADHIPSDPLQAIRHAEEAVRLAPELGIYWNTLGAAYFRAGDYRSAVASLEKSMDLREGGDSFDWFFLAMSHWKLGDRASALRIYQEAVFWMELHARGNSELARFREEADALLDV